MGQAIAVMIVDEIYVSKFKDNGWGTVSEVNLEDIQKKLSIWFDLEFYNVEEGVKGVAYTLKEDVFQEYFLSFLSEQAEELEYADRIRKSVKQLQEVNPSKYLEMIKEYEADPFFYADSGFLETMYCSKGLDMKIYGVAFMSEGKVLMVCYSQTFSYLHKLIRKSFKNPLRNAVMITLV